MRTSQRPRFGIAFLLTFALYPMGAARAADRPAPLPGGPLRAGAHAQDVTPRQFPVRVNGMFTERSADRAHDPLYARCLVLDDGATRLAIVVVDSCMMPRELLDRAKDLANQSTGIPTDRILISATHTHSAPSVMGCLGSRADEAYAAFLAPEIAKGIEQAVKNLAPARVGWAVAQAPEYTHTRRWIFRPDRMRTDPFGDLTVRANMHPGYQSPDAVGPAGPADPELAVLSVQSPDGRPVALLANYSMHYFGSPAVSADYFGLFAGKVAGRLGADKTPDGSPPFVAMLSQGTSGDLYLADYRQPPPGKKWEIGEYTDAIVAKAMEAYGRIEYRDRVSLAMAESKLTLGRRTPDEKRLAWARGMVAKLGDRLPKTHPEVYATEAIFLHDEPTRELKLQAVRVGDLGITAIPNEVYALTGLKLKALSPLRPTFNISLANGSEGYIPPPEQHHLGGYNTWPARTAALEVQAEPKIVEAVVTLLEKVAAKPRRPFVETHGPYAEAVLASKPLAYWRVGEWAGPTAKDSSENGHDGAYEPGVVFYLDGPPSPVVDRDGQGNRSSHFAGGRVRGNLKDLGSTYTVELWFWNGMPGAARPVAGYLFSRGEDKTPAAAGDHLGIGGTHAAQDRLFFFNGNERNTIVAGRMPIALRTWNHVVLVRDGPKVAVYLNGNKEPEIAGEAEPSIPPAVGQFFVGGRNDNFANFEGKIDEVAVYDRKLTPDEIAAHYAASGLNPLSPVRGGEGEKRRRDSDPKSPAESLAALHVKDGFEVELVAAEPLVVDPVAFDWGPDGKLWVVEMADYPYGLDGKMKAGSRVKFLEDADGDGKYDKATLFLDGVNFANGVLPWRNGVLVTAAPEIFYAEDTDGDGRADVRRTLYRGFKEGNPQLRVNGLRFGLDNWVYCANGWSGGVVESVKTGATVDLARRADLRIRPDDGAIEVVSGVSQYGRNRDDWGNWFGCDNSHPLFHYVLEDAYLRRNPFGGASEPKEQLLVPRNPPVYPRSRGQKRYHSFENAGHFTSACSAMVYRDELLFGPDPPGVQHAFVCEPVHNLVQHVVLTETGVTFTASRASDEQKLDVLASEDPWFRPVMVRTGPDGALYVADMYRYMIEHPDWLPKLGQDELRPFYRDGDDRGRIYRVHPKGKRPRRIPRLDNVTAPQLVASLDHPGGWQRDTAQMLLLWRNDPAAVEVLEALASSPSSPLARLNALCALDGLGALMPELIERAFSDPHPAVRRHAVRLAEARAADHPRLVEAAAKLADDHDAKVRLQLACTLGAWDAPAAGAALAKMAAAHGNDPWMTAACVSSAAPHRSALVAALADTGRAVPGPLFDALAALSLERQDRAALARLLAGVTRPRDGDTLAADQLAALARWLDSLPARKTSLDQLTKVADDPLAARLRELPALFEHARQVATDPSRLLDIRVAAIALLGRERAKAEDDSHRLAALLAPQTPADVQAAAVRAIGRAGGPAPELLLRDWAQHSPQVRAAAADVLLAREPWALKLLRAIEAGRVAPQDIDPSRRDRLLRHRSEPVKSLAEKLLGGAGDKNREQVVEANRSVLAMAADAKRGQAVFAKHCATCHRLGGVGQDVGPDLRSVRDWEPEALLASILDPNRQAEPRYLAYTATLAGGDDVVYGVITAETGAALAMKGLDGQERQLARDSIQSLTSTGRSLMPDGFESGMTRQDLADVIRFLKTD